MPHYWDLFVDLEFIVHPWTENCVSLQFVCFEAHRTSHLSRKQQQHPFQCLPHRLKICESRKLNANRVRRTRRRGERPIHIDTTPNRQSFPRRPISCSKVATQRAPAKVFEHQEIKMHLLSHHVPTLFTHPTTLNISHCEVLHFNLFDLPTL